ncbi:hypothetical protein BUALT_Bualt19G0090500 [Buddleja alternifolia]|uniref:Complex III subunit VI n=1 Tax=Buddleja alternifolia TaxID=168488 RepID=A0AAV6WAW8_9LAMI|nr:hypothetical protein BUALT_Bualt19G0090500 [Buddleja alternifolia]
MFLQVIEDMAIDESRAVELTMRLSPPFSNWLLQLVLSLRADDEPVDPKREYEDRCKAPCTRPLKEYQNFNHSNFFYSLTYFSVSAVSSLPTAVIWTSSIVVPREENYFEERSQEVNYNLIGNSDFLEENCLGDLMKDYLCKLETTTGCAKRIQDDDSGHKHCTGQYFDYWRCVDKCVATKLFSQLK